MTRFCMSSVNYNPLDEISVGISIQLCLVLTKCFTIQHKTSLPVCNVLLRYFQRIVHVLAATLSILLTTSHYQYYLLVLNLHTNGLTNLSLN